jgi:hypothetical protein
VPVDAEQGWIADLEDEEEPQPDIEYWEDGDLTPEELTAWHPGPDSLPQAEGVCPT